MSGRLADAKGDGKMVNATLRESFARFELSRAPDGGYWIVPVAATLESARILRDNAESDGDPSDGLGTTRFAEHKLTSATAQASARSTTGPAFGNVSGCQVGGYPPGGNS